MAEDERRRAPRIPTKSAVKLRPTEGTTPYMLNAEAENMSERGVFFYFNNAMAVGTSIELSMTMPADVTGGLPMKIRCTARVVRVEPGKTADGKVGIAAHIERFETIIAEA
jgi:hypothetical protein